MMVVTLKRTMQFLDKVAHPKRGSGLRRLLDALVMDAPYWWDMHPDVLRRLA